MNKIILSGRLSQNPKTAEKNIDIALFNIAVSRKRNSKDTDYFRCVAFGQSAKYVLQYGTTGMSIELEGECQNYRYTDKMGMEHVGSNVIVDSLRFLSKNPNQSQSENYIRRKEHTNNLQSQQVSAFSEVRIPPEMLDEMPFK